MSENNTRVIRLDSMSLSQTFFTPEGYLRDRPVLTSTGVFEYTNSDGSVRRELRLPEEVFDSESLKSYLGKPIIITHDAGLITKDNVSGEQIGTILSEGYKDKEDVRAEIIIHDTDEMKQCGLKELSLGYNLDLDETPGVWKGQKYDAVQRNIRINHLALVREARAGEQARLNIDSRDSKTILKGGKKAMRKTRRNDGILSPEELQKAIEDYKAKRAANGKAKPVTKKDSDNAVDKKPVEPASKKAAPADMPIEEKVQLVKDRRDRRDEEGDPKNMNNAMGMIAHQDEDIDTLFDIIDTLLAERDFAKDADEKEETPVDELEENLDEEEEMQPVPAKKKPLPTAAMDEDLKGEEIVMDTDCDEDEELAMDAEELLDEEQIDGRNCDSDEDDIPSTDTVTPTVNVDSVDKLVRQRVKLGMVGRMLNLDGLEDMPIKRAKAAVIKAVKPGIRLDGKSNSYIDAAFDCACEEITRRNRKGTSYQKKQMFNKDGVSKRAVSGAEAARNRMISRQHNKKED